MLALVTGGSGFIGRHLVRALSARGDRVAVIGRRSPSELRKGVFPPGVVYERGDLAEPGVADDVIRRLRPDRVFHLASSTDVTRDLKILDEQFRVNQTAAVQVALASREHDVGRLIHVGTCEEYGNGPAPFRETQDPAPVSPYSAAKVAATAFVRMLCSSFGLRAVVVRPFLTYGPEQESNLLVPALIRCAMRGRDFPMTAGEQTRELNYVTDIVDGFLRAGDAPGVDGQIINIGCGEPRRIRDIASLVLDLMGNPIRAEFGKLPYRPGETWEFYCANDRARTLLGWAPKVSLEEGLQVTIAWYREHERIPA
jgi:nucleoside-diphosphate-sugar epimerase